MDIFADEDEQIVAEVIDAEPVAEEPKEPVRDEKGRFAPKGEEQSVSPAPVEEPPFDHAAVIGERKRRQEAEERLKALEAELSQLRTPQEPPAPPPSVWEDENAFRGDVVSTAVSQASLNAKLDMSEMLASQAHEDFDNMKDKFLQMANLNPAIAQQALAAKHPWEKAYQIAKNAATMEELGATNVAEIEAKLREKLEAEYATKAQAPAAPALPTSLADAPAGMGAPASSGTQPFSLADIIGR